MIRIGLVLLAFTMCCGAWAQPAPRATMDVDLPASPGFKLNTGSQQGQLAAGGDGVLNVLLHEFMPGTDPSSTNPAREARIQILAVTAAGVVKQRQTVPLKGAMGSEGFLFNSVGLIAVRSGDLAVFTSGSGDSGPGRRAGQESTLVRLGTDFSVKKTASIGPPGTAPVDPAAYYSVSIFVPTSDDALLLAGGYGSGPYAWWIGKFSLDGARIWQAGPGSSFPETVRAASQRPDGSWVSIVQEAPPPKRAEQQFIHRHAPDGKPLFRQRLAYTFGYVPVVLREGCVLIASENGPTIKSELLFLDDGGRLLRRAPWPFPRTLWAIADGEGFAAVVGDSDYGPSRIVRVDGNGAIRWRSPLAEFNEITRTPDGQIAALVRQGYNEKLRLVRYADP